MKKSSGKSETERPEGEKRPGGRQRGSRGHGRRDYSRLEAETEVLRLPETERTCSVCGLPFEEFPDTEDSEILEIEVRAHRRIVKRKKYIPAYWFAKHLFFTASIRAEASRFSSSGKPEKSRASKACMRGFRGGRELNRNYTL